MKADIKTLKNDTKEIRSELKNILAAFDEVKKCYATKTELNEKINEVKESYSCNENIKWKFKGYGITVISLIIAAASAIIALIAVMG